MEPCIPAAWSGFTLTYRHGGSTPYVIRVDNPDGVCRGIKHLVLDGTELPNDSDMRLLDDRATHQVRVTLG